jgi:[ribosomal protein S5]-alanine N-acetyltransferase
MAKLFTTSRLTLQPLQIKDGPFIQTLVNTAGWLQFIGDRNIHTIEAAEQYINKILANQAITYWTVTLIEHPTAIGLITLIKRTYLNHPDIGFAFLPQFEKKGYAFEAAMAVLQHCKLHLPIIHATTLADNISSIKLLNKLGFLFTKVIEVDGESLQVYSC